MAEGLLNGLKGGEVESIEREAIATAIAGQVASGSEAAATAVSLNSAIYGPKVEVAAQMFLKGQAKVLKTQEEVLKAQNEVLQEQRRQIHVQTHHLEAEHGLRMGLLQGQLVSQRLRIGLQLFGVLLLTALGLGILLMFHDAVTSNAVVVDVFETPPALASRGVTGTVVASEVLNTLKALQSATRSTEKNQDTVGAWQSDIRIEVPETGASIGEISRLIHERFGHDLHIHGELVQGNSGGLALTVWGDNVQARTFTGEDEDFGKLALRAAEYIYGRAQPAEYAKYLGNHHRAEEALAFVSATMGRATSNTERAALANMWANAFANLDRPAEAAEKFHLALSYEPGNWRYWRNFINGLYALGGEGEERAWREAQAFLGEARAASGKGEVPLRWYEGAASVVWDRPLVLSADQSDSQFNSGAGSGISIAGPGIAEDFALMHDLASASLTLATSDPEDPLTRMEGLMLAAYDALDSGHFEDAVAPMHVFWQMWQTEKSLHWGNGDDLCVAGLVFGLAGQVADAEAVFRAAVPSSRCLAFHGDVLEHAGHLSEAEKVWSDGLKIGPDLPQIYLHRGISELQRGDFKNASADLATANEKAPHYADPLKAWGDLLAIQGREKEALAKYDEALRYAPAWEQLKRVRDETAAKAK
ncbi:MAG: hypothetical protein JOZ83_05300 [Silvibacterium sp.]|nr:hypothetical protein [Silvibacterium sp.]